MSTNFKKTWFSLAIMAFFFGLPVGAMAQEDYFDLSLEELMEISFSSVSKWNQNLSEAPAAISVVTKEDLRRRGIDNLTDALRMVPGVHVATGSSDQTVVTIRGFPDRLSNKLLILVDGQQIYSEVYGGVFWGLNTIPIDDIEQIEVVRGPGASVWGVNSVNGVINIMTKNAADQESAVRMIAASDGQQATIRTAGRVGQYTHARLSVAADDEDGLEGGELSSLSSFLPAYTAADARASDNGVKRRHLTLRVDREKDEADQMFYYSNQETDFNFDSFPNLGAQTLSEQSFERAIARSSFATGSRTRLTAQASYKTEDIFVPGLADSSVETSAGEIRHLHGWERNQLVYGITYSDSASRADGLPSLLSSEPVFGLDPASRGIVSKGAFIQGEYNITSSLALTAGTRYDENTLSGASWQPSARFVKTFESTSTLWGAISQTVRTPSRVSVNADFQFVSVGPGGIVQIANIRGNANLEPETALVGELGYRMSIDRRLSIDLAVFFHEIKDLTVRTTLGVQPVPGAVIISTIMDSSGDASYKGFEWELDWDFDRYSFGVHGAFSSIDFSFDDAAVSVAPAENSPVSAKYLLGSYARWNIGDSWEFDLWAQFVDDIEAVGLNVKSDSFLRVDSRVAYVAIPQFTLALVLQDIGDSGDVEHRDENYSFSPYSGVRMGPVYKIDLEYVF